MLLVALKRFYVISNSEQVQEAGFSVAEPVIGNTLVRQWRGEDRVAEPVIVGALVRYQWRGERIA